MPSNYRVKHNDDSDLSELGSICPYCKIINAIPDGSCEHYVGYYNVAECEWEFSGIMKEWNDLVLDEFGAIEDEIERLQSIIDDGIGAYQNNRMNETLNGLGSYEVDSDEIMVSPTCFTSSDMMFLNNKEKDAVKAIIQKMFIDKNKQK